MGMKTAAPPGSQKGPRITVSVSKCSHIAVVALAQKHDVSLSWLTRQALVEFIEKYEDTQAQLALHIRKDKADA